MQQDSYQGTPSGVPQVFYIDCAFRQCDSETGSSRTCRPPIPNSSAHKSNTPPALAQTAPSGSQPDPQQILPAQTFPHPVAPESFDSAPVPTIITTPARIALIPIQTESPVVLDPWP